MDGSPARLTANARKAFIGSYLLGMGFTFDDVAAAKGEAESLDTMHALIARNQRNAERIFPYIGGEEVNSSPTHSHHRYAIDFFDLPLRRDSDLAPWATMDDKERSRCRTMGIVPTDYPYEVAMDWPDLLEIVRRRVKPVRDIQKRDALRVRWWQYAEKRPGLYRMLASLDRVLVTSRVRAGLFTFMPPRIVLSEQLVVFPLPGFQSLAVLQSCVHDLWMRFFSGTALELVRYTPSDCFETFPFPPGFETDPALESAGRAYHDYRAQLMVARNEGMTKTYNRFHDPEQQDAEIVRLRELHAAMDRAVLAAYGWRDLAARAEPIFLDESQEDDHTYQGRLFWPSDFRDEVLSRLLALNAHRHAEEAAAGLVAETRGGAAAEDEGEEAEEA